MKPKSTQVAVIGAGIGGLTTAALLARAGYQVTVLESQTYAGGCAGTFYHQGYRFDAGATLAGGFQPDGPHDLVGNMLDIQWRVRPVEVAWEVHLPGQTIALTQSADAVVKAFPQSEPFWTEQQGVADMCWSMAAQGLPFPPTSLAEMGQLFQVGLAYFPQDLRLTRYAFSSVNQWLTRHHLQHDVAFKRFVDAQLLISAQATSDNVNSLYGATALDLPRQGVQHVERGIGGIAEQLAESLQREGGTIHYRQTVTDIVVQNGRVVGVKTKHGRRDGDYFPCDVLVANLTPWSLHRLLGENSPSALQREVRHRQPGWGAFVLYLGITTTDLPKGIADHHQILPSLQGDLGETNSLFVSMSPEWDTSRAPKGHRAVTVTTHTRVQPWWDLLEQGQTAYEDRKHAYAERMLAHIEAALPGFQRSIRLNLPGTPVTYQFYTQRHLGMVGGFPQQSLLKARGPRTGLSNLRLVGDSIFPGQSTAGVTLGAIRVARDIQRHWQAQPRQAVALAKMGFS